MTAALFFSGTTSVSYSSYVYYLFTSYILLWNIWYQKGAALNKYNPGLFEAPKEKLSLYCLILALQFILEQNQN